MSSMIRIGLLGGTGNVGRHVICEALSRGHTITALARDPAKLPQPFIRNNGNGNFIRGSLQPFKGDVMDITAITDLVNNNDVIISCIGGRSRNDTICKK